LVTCGAAALGQRPVASSSSSSSRSREAMGAARWHFQQRIKRKVCGMLSESGLIWTELCMGVCQSEQHWVGC
jgi:hypothetical protein